MMGTYTNMTWPDDPYRTGQRLYRRPAPRLAAFTAERTVTGGHLVPSAVAIVYLPLHRTQAMSVTEQTLTFGFRAASTEGPADVPALAAMANLGLMQALRHADVLTGHLLADNLAPLRRASGVAGLRGLAAIESEWTCRGRAAGRAVTLDCGLDLPGASSLELACQHAGIAPGAGTDGADDGEAVTLAVARALMIALVCARHLGRYEWAETLHIGPVLAAATWDCLPQPATGTATALTTQTAADSGVDAGGPSLGTLK
jgi:hypothetical protein